MVSMGCDDIIPVRWSKQWKSQKAPCQSPPHAQETRTQFNTLVSLCAALHNNNWAGFQERLRSLAPLWCRSGSPRWRKDISDCTTVVSEPARPTEPDWSWGTAHNDHSSTCWKIDSRNSDGKSAWREKVAVRRSLPRAPSPHATTAMLVPVHTCLDWLMNSSGL